MAPLTKDRHTPFIENLTQVALPVAAQTTIFKNSLVCLNANGEAVPAINTDGFLLAGVSEGDGESIRGVSTVINATLQPGAINVLVRRNGSYLFNCASVLTQNDIGKPLFVLDDQTVTLDVTESTVLAGVFARYESPTEAWVDIYPATVTGLISLLPITP